MKYSQTDQCYALLWAKKIKAIRYLGGKCSVCSNEDIFVLEFHHSDEKKKGGINSFLQGKDGCSSKWSLIEKELNKCQLICRNCHMELHGYKEHPMKEELMKLINQDKCCICGYRGKNTTSLDFHHKFGNKLFRISNCYNNYNRKDVKKSIGLEVVLEELKKCQLLCRNCHGKEHTKIDKFKQLMPFIEYKVEHYLEKMKWDRNKIKELYANGIKYKEMAKILRCSYDTVFREINRMIKEKSIVKRRKSNLI